MMAESDPERQGDTTPPESSEEDHQMRRRRRGLLRMYYGVNDSAQAQQDNPLDIDKAGFKSEVYMEKVLKECSLNDLYKQEGRMKKEIQELDSNMQYLVYENHSKFIKASETIREMKDDFQHLEDDMGTLGVRMEEITSSSNSINTALEDRKKEISKLCGVHHLLKKLQFLFELPTRLTKCMDLGFYSQAVRTYSRARRVLEQYQHMPSFHGIQQDCSTIVSKLIVTLKQRMDDEKASTATVVETVDLLLELNEPARDLCHQFLANSRRQLERDLNVVRLGEKPQEVQNEDGELMDIQEYIHLVCSGFFGNVSLVIQTFQDLFIRRHQTSTTEDRRVEEEALRSLTEFVHSLMDSCLQTVQERLKSEACHQESRALIRALDHISGKLQAMDNLLPSAKFSEKGYQLVTLVTGTHTECHSQRLQQSFTDALMSVRHSLVTSRGASSHLEAPTLDEHSASLYASIKSGLESSLTNLKEFVESNVSFSERADFRRKFCVGNIHAGIVVTFIDFVLETCKSFSEAGGGEHSTSSYPPALILILSKLVHQMERSTISYLVSYGDEKFPPVLDGPPLATPTGELLRQAKILAQALLNHYVKVQGQVISQMIRKSVETRDWLNTIEPRNIRSVMKRVVEEMTLIEKQVGTLYEDGVRKDQGSESSRHTYSYSRGYVYAPNTLDSSLMSNIQKLFYERIEVFGTVQFDKASIVTGIIKIFLKALLECVRLRTFGKFGLQQMQVDCHYLQVYLWKFVSDEQLVRVLLEQVIASTMERCVDSALMEQSVVELICERN